MKFGSKKITEFTVLEHQLKTNIMFQHSQKKNQTSQRFPTNDEITRITTLPPCEATLHLNISCFFFSLNGENEKKSIVTIKPKKKNPSLFPTTTPLP